VAPLQVLPRWSDSHIPTASVRDHVRALRGAEAQPEGAAHADPAHDALAPTGRARELGGLPLLVFEYERDKAEARGELLQRLAPPGSVPEDWPQRIRLLQYAGEGTQGGTVRQNLLDMYRRIDSFLYKHLSKLAGGPGLQREPFVDELPFISASLLSETRGDLSAFAQSIEGAFEELFKYSGGAQAAELPSLRTAGKASGFGSKKTTGKRKALVAPASRLHVRDDGTIEVTVAFPEEPQGLHVLLSQVWLHIRAEGLGFTVGLPRQPLPDQPITVFRSPSGKSFVFEIPADPYIGAIENYNHWAGQGKGASIMSVLRPEEILAAPVIVPTEVLDV